MQLLPGWAVIGTAGKLLTIDVGSPVQWGSSLWCFDRGTGMLQLLQKYPL